MSTDTQPTWPLPAEDIESVRRLKARLEESADAIGSWTGKSDNRQTGVSYHAKFANKVDVIQAMQFTRIIEESPSLLAWALEVILQAAEGYAISSTPKMLRETLCVAQTHVGNSGDLRAQEHVARLQELINECDRKRPLGSDGKHGELHTDQCGCER